MKALTIQQPWASLILLGPKRVENRTWWTKYRGPLAIHAGLKFDRFGIEVAAERGIKLPPLGAIPAGVILGAIDLVDVVEYSGPQQLLVDDAYGLRRDPWARGPVCWILRNPRPLPEPVPARGFPGLWEWDGKCKVQSASGAFI
jgi:hypothetical protein